MLQPAPLGLDDLCELRPEISRRLISRTCFVHEFPEECARHGMDSPSSGEVRRRFADEAIEVPALRLLGKLHCGLGRLPSLVRDEPVGISFGFPAIPAVVALGAQLNFFRHRWEVVVATRTQPFGEGLSSLVHHPVLGGVLRLASIKAL